MTEATTWKVVLAVGAGISALLLFGVLTLQAIGFLWLAGTVDELPSIRNVSSILVDEFVESGALPPSSAIENALLDTRTIVVTNAINEYSSKLIVESLFLLNSQDSDSPIDLFMTSPGGWVGSAFSVIDSMKVIDAPVNAHAVGMCYSSCALILAASTGTRTASPNAIIMVHANLDQSDTAYSYDAVATARYETVWKDYAELPKAWFPMTKDKAYYLTAEQALEFKIIDRVNAKDKQ